jgi:hypothetical protein
MATYQIINLETGEFSAVSLEEAAEIASLDPNEIAWAIEEHGVCETDAFQITKLNDPPEGDASDGGDGDIESEAAESGEVENKFLTPVFVYITQEEFEAHIAQHPAAVIRLRWDEPIIRHAVEADRERIMSQLRDDASEEVEPSGVFHLTRESIALIR